MGTLPLHEACASAVHDTVFLTRRRLQWFKYFSAAYSLTSYA